MRASVGYILAGLLVCMGLLQATASARMARMAHEMEPHPPKPSSGPKASPSPVVVGTTPIRADYKTARKAYPWCKTAVTDSYFLEPTVTTKTTGSGAKQYVFAMDEDYGACLDFVKRMGRNDTSLCRTPFYSFMIAISPECHEAVMVVNTAQLLMRQDKPGAKDVPMYCHSHKGHDTGVPLLKFLAKPTYLQPSTTAPYTKRRFIFTLSVMPREADQAACADIRTLCGGDRCMVALSDEEYGTCPAFVAMIM